MYMLTGQPFTGKMQEKLQSFLLSCQLDYDPSVDFTVLLLEEDDDILATASLSGDTIRCVAVAPSHQGEDLTARVITPVMQHAFAQGKKHLLLYTKPHNQALFAPFGFHPVIRTSDCLLMENKKSGLKDFLSALEKPDVPGDIGCIVANCNPFTLGHRYLIETAAAECAHVHVFVLSEDKGLFTPAERLQMVKSGCADLKNVSVHPSGPYMVSSATFPSYFIKDKARTNTIRCSLDVRLFGEKIAPALRITKRYIGTEPACTVTAQYNQTLLQLLPQYGVQAVEIPRKMLGDQIISASRVRQLIKDEKFDQLSACLPPSTLTLLHAIKGEILCRIHSECSET